MMKKLLTVLITAATMVGAMAEVPSLINYQGRLKEKSGSNVNGTKNFTVRIFDAKEGGKQTYEENVGAVVIKEGAYSFGFGEAGQSILDFSESLIVEEDGKQIFDFTLSRTPLGEGLSIQAGEFTWSEKTGSSDSDNLLVQYDKNNKSAKIIFLNSSLGKDAALKFDYRITAEGVLGGLSSAKSSWLEITVGGETLSPRERLVSVPFALKAMELTDPNRSVLASNYNASLVGLSTGSGSTRLGLRGDGPLGAGQPFETKFYAPGSTKIIVEVYTQSYGYFRNNVYKTIHKAPDLEPDLSDLTLRPIYEPSEPNIKTVKLNEIHDDRKLSPFNNKYLKRYTGVIPKNGFYSLRFLSKPLAKGEHYIMMNMSFGIIAE